MSGEQGDDGDTGTESVEREARLMGWVPKEEFRGPEENWRDAADFVKRGQEFMPFLKANNRRLIGDLEKANAELAALKSTVTQQSQTMKDLLEHQAAEVQRQVESKLADLKAEKKAAIREGDHERAADLEDAIDETREALAKAAAAKPATPATPLQQPNVEPWAKEFGEANDDWLGKDKRKTALFMGIADDLFASTSLRGAALLAEAKKQLEETLTPKSKAAKSEGGNGGWDGGGRGAGGARSGKSYNDLPADAKAVCDRQEAKFVGEGKAFKTQAEWRSHYAKTVLGE